MLEGFNPSGKSAASIIGIAAAVFLAGFGAAVFILKGPAEAKAAPAGAATSADLLKLNKRMWRLERRVFQDMVLIKTRLGIKVEAEAISVGDGE